MIFFLSIQRYNTINLLIILNNTISKVVVTVTADGRSKDIYYFDIAPGESDMSAITVAADAFLYVSDVQVFF